MPKIKINIDTYFLSVSVLRDGVCLTTGFAEMFSISGTEVEIEILREKIESAINSGATRMTAMQTGTLEIPSKYNNPSSYFIELSASSIIFS